MLQSTSIRQQTAFKVKKKGERVPRKNIYQGTTRKWILCKYIASKHEGEQKIDAMEANINLKTESGSK